MTEIVINGVSVASMADYAKMRHLKVAFVRDNIVKGDDQSEPLKPVYMLSRTGMYSIDELDKAYLERGSKGITLASMGYLHPAKAKELESRLLEVINEKAEAESNLAESETDLEKAEQKIANQHAELLKYRELLDEQAEIIKDQVRELEYQRARIRALGGDSGKVEE